MTAPDGLPRTAPYSDLETEYVRLLWREGKADQVFDLLPASLRQNIRIRSQGRLSPEESYLFSNGHPLLWLIRHLGISVEDELRKSGYSVSGAMYANVLASGSFSAQAKPVTGGAIVFVNSGAIALLLEMLWRYARDLDTRDPEPAPIRTKSIAKIAKFLIGTRDTRRITIPHGDAYVDFFDDVSLHKRRSLEPWRYLFRRLADSCVRFLIAHEYAHYISGHLIDVGTPLRKEQEFEADVVGAQIMLSSKSTEALEVFAQMGQPLLYFACLAGCRFNFSVHRLVDEAVGTPDGSGDHPPSIERSDLLDRFFKKEARRANLPANSLELPRPLDDWLEENRRVLLTEVSRQLGRAASKSPSA